MDFGKKWAKKDDPSRYDALVEAIKPSDPLRSRLQASIKRIEMENRHLDQSYARFESREKELFAKTVEAYKAHDEKRSLIYANEVAEVRKIMKMMLQIKLALEQIALRMRTSTELGDVAASLLPVVNVMNDLKTGISSISPQTEREMGELGGLLSGMVADGGLVGIGSISFDVLGEEANTIIDEAQVVAESKISEGFPQLPKKSDHFLAEDDSKP
jgi:division protein CdvB (Snf7/Vps24/ESCRT-III family)